MKKIKRILVLFLLTLITTGCNVEYNLNIDSTVAKEKMIVSLDKTSENKKFVNRISDAKISSYFDSDHNEDMYYDIKIKEKDESYEVDYNYEYPLEKLKFSNAIGQCFYNKSIFKDTKYITINTSEGANCIYKDTDKQIDNLVINIKTKYKVLETNADTVKDNKYTWNINDSNYESKSIYMKIDYTKKDKSFIEKHAVAIAISLLSVTILVFILLIYFKIRRNKKI